MLRNHQSETLSIGFRLAGVILIAALGSCFGCARNLPQSSTKPEASAATGPLAGLAWLSGSWASVEAGNLSEEHWTAPSTNLMLGMNRTVDAGVTKHHEQLRIESKDDGVFYVASPSGQETTAFKLVEGGDSHAVFENLDHDYPKRITYRRTGPTLTVTIEGDPGDRVAEWRWQRSALPTD